MKTQSLCISALFILASSVLFSDNTIRMAVSPFITVTASADSEKAGTKASALIESALSKDKWFELRKAGELENFMGSLALAQAGAGDEDKITALGKDLNIRYLTVGSVAKFDFHYEVDSRSVNIDNWRIVHSSGCSAIDVDSACAYINKDVEITLTKENLESREKAGTNLPSISVNRFNESNIDAQKAGYGATIAEILNSELGAHASISTIERTHLRSVIDAKAMVLCGIYNGNDDSGKAFNARGIAYKVDGDIKLFPSLICIRYSISTTLDNRMFYYGYREISTLDGLRPAVRKIAGEIDDAINKKIGTLTLKSSPENIEISIDGEPCGKTPLTMSFTKGNHFIRAIASGFETLETQIVIEPAKINSKTITLKKISTSLYEEAVRLEQSKNWQAAVAKYDAFIEKYGTSIDVNQAIYRKGHLTLLYLNNAKDALDTFESLVKRYPDAETRAEAYFGIARSWKALGNTKMVKQTLDILYQKFPEEIATEEARAFFAARKN